MKLNFLNETYEEDEIFDQALGKYVKARGAGNINKKQAIDDPDKDDSDDSMPNQTDRSGNQTAPGTNDPENRKFLGASGNSRDKQSPPNLAGQA